MDYNHRRHGYGKHYGRFNYTNAEPARKNLVIETDLVQSCANG